MNSGMTQQSLNALQVFQSLAPLERRWVLEAVLIGIDTTTRSEIFRLIQSKMPTDETLTQNRSSYDNVKNILLDDPNLSTADKVLLGSFAICDLYELKEFSGRQVTEFLKETSNEIGNVTAAMTALVQRGFAEIISKGGDTQQAQKRYTLTSTGLAKTQTLIQSSHYLASQAKVRNVPPSSALSPDSSSSLQM